MHFLNAERATLARLLPGLDASLAAHPLSSLETPGNPGLRLYREHGGPGLLIPADHGGAGATPLEAVQVQRALAARSPSLAVATTMHHFSVATLLALSSGPAASGFEWLALEGIARQRLHVASGFAEGRTGAGILSSQIRARRSADGWLISGSKKPCSLAHSMDLLTASVCLPDEHGEPGPLAVVLIAATTPGIERRPFWNSWVLAGAESDEVVLHDVLVPDNLVAVGADRAGWDDIQRTSFVWFELLITASYLGAASALVERILLGKRAGPAERVALVVELEAAMSGLECVARQLGEGSPDEALLARALFVRYGAQQAIKRATSRAAELLGGMAFIGSPDAAYLLAASRALAFHPPSRLGGSTALDDYLAGGRLVLE